MIREDLLNQELNHYRKHDNQMNPIKYNRNFIFNLFRKYKEYGMTENSYCCYGEETCCWQEIMEEGNWNLTLSMIRKDILYLFKNIRHILRSSRKYGERMYMYQNKDCCYIYIYTRDLIQKDYAIWFKR
jgi:hypothetical protein